MNNPTFFTASSNRTIVGGHPALDHLPPLEEDFPSREEAISWLREQGHGGHVIAQDGARNDVVAVVDSDFQCAYRA